jgi:hypothetical protein
VNILIFRAVTAANSIGELNDNYHNFRFHPVIQQVTQRITERSRSLRTAYLEQHRQFKGRPASQQFVMCQSGPCQCGDGQ